MMSAQSIRAWMDDFGVSMAQFYVDHGRDILNRFHDVFNVLFYVLLVIATLATVIYIVLTIISLFIKPEKETSIKLTSKNTPFVTIQIPTYNELAAINCAKRCLAFDYPKDRYEIIIGDDSNDKAISAKIDAFAKKTGVVVTRRGSNTGFKPGNLNHMLTKSKGEYLLIFDSDYLPEKDFLRRLVQPVLKDQSIACVQARWKVMNPTQNFTTVLGTSIVETFHHIIIPILSRFSPSVTLCGSAELIKKSDLIALGGWKHGCLTEDIDFSFRLMTAGKRVVYIPTLTCGSEVPQTAKDLFKQQMRWAYGVIRALIENGSKIIGTSISTTFSVVLFASGYLLTSLIFLMFIVGVLSLLTHPPEPINWALFFSETFRNILLSSGLLITSFVAAMRARRGFAYVSKLFVTSFSVGLVLVLFVVKGIYKACTSQPMHWFMLRKNGNTQQI
ncbi:MAG TPA: glycosyltransferase [Acidobacteriota bacterium]|nr:glycosyltransferase [Acidobacteriota bacterium]